ncbi:MAG: EAL domain-containing protein [Pseudomonadota bacterium]
MNGGAAHRTGTDAAAPARRRLPRERTLLCAGLMATIAVIVATSAFTLVYLRALAEARVAATTQNLAKSMVLTFDGIFDAIDVAIRASGDEIVRLRADGAPHTREADAFLARQQQRLPVAPRIRATDAAGTIAYGVAAGRAPVSVAGRDYFKALRARPQAGLYVAAPIVSQVSGKWSWLVARRIEQPGGAFGGVVVGVLDLAQIQAVLDKIKLDAGGSIVLRHAGFEAVAARAGWSAKLPFGTGDKRLSPELRLALARDARRGTYSTSRSVLAGSMHTFSYERSGKYGFYVWVGEADAVALADWRRQVWIISGLTAAFVLLAGGFLLRMGRAWRRQERDLQSIRRLAYYDQLTGLPNRRLLIERLAAQAGKAGPAGGARRGALLLVGLDHFKSFNDTHGHAPGDLLLKAVAQRLLGAVRGGDTVARLAGDEFYVLVGGLPADPERARILAGAIGEKLRRTLASPFEFGGHQHKGTASIGITLFGGHASGIDDAAKRAETALYQAKAAGRNVACFFDPAMQAAALERLGLEHDLSMAIASDQFLLHYQAQVDAGGRATGAEVLLRWQHPVRGLVPPARFIALAEENGLIYPIGHWVLETACAQLAAWSRDPQLGALTLAVNVSACQFKQPDFVAQVLAVLARTGADPRRLKLELTEGLLLDNTEVVIATIKALKRVGVGFSLDDFGTGYSSLSYLKRLPLDQLKIDQSFVRDLLTDATDVAIVRTIVALGQSLGMEVIAEGVETAAQRDCLAAAGCVAWQGFLFGAPLPLAQFEQSLRHGPGAAGARIRSVARA